MPELVSKMLLSPPESGLYNQLVLDYFAGNKNLEEYFKYIPDLESFSRVMLDKSRHPCNRKLLSDVLESQYLKAGIIPEANVKNNIESLRNANTFTICTGHQPSLFTGPIFFIYKIISTINLTRILEKKYPENKFVPVFWLASEDHDFEELNHAFVFGKKIEWNYPNTKATGRSPAGRLNGSSLQFVLNELKAILGTEEKSKEIFELFSGAYSGKKKFADASRILIDKLFGSYGLVIIDGDEPILKKEITSLILDDILQNTPHRLVKITSEKLKADHYHPQVNPREINCFYLTDNSRERIEKTELGFKILNTNKLFSEEEMKSEIAEHPERFSPNVVLRPLFQEKILPNLAYMGGPAEVSYWLQYKAMFDYFGINFPLLMVRNSVLWIDSHSASRMKKLQIKTGEIFQNKEEVIRSFVLKQEGNKADLKQESLPIANAFDQIMNRISFVDASLKPAVEAEKKRNLNAIKMLEEKMLKALKKKQETSIEQIQNLFSRFFPSEIPQERYDNFIPLFLKYGNGLFEILLDHLNPFEKQVIILTEETA